jgi:hypothetical protein
MPKDQYTIFCELRDTYNKWHQAEDNFGCPVPKRAGQEAFDAWVKWRAGWIDAYCKWFYDWTHDCDAPVSGDTK